MLYPHWDSSMYYLVFVYVSFIIINVQKNQAASNVLLRVKELKYFHFSFSFQLFLTRAKNALCAAILITCFTYDTNIISVFRIFLTLGLVPHYIFKLVLFWRICFDYSFFLWYGISLKIHFHVYSGFFFWH